MRISKYTIFSVLLYHVAIIRIQYPFSLGRVAQGLAILLFFWIVFYAIKKRRYIKLSAVGTLVTMFCTVIIISGKLNISTSVNSTLMNSVLLAVIIIDIFSGLFILEKEG